MECEPIMGKKLQVKTGGKLVDFESKFDGDIQAQFAATEFLKTNKNEFITGLMSELVRRGRLSYAQMAWIHYYASGLMNKPGDRTDVAKLFEHFKKAQGEPGQIKLQCPKMYVMLGDREVRLKMAKPGGRNAGYIYINEGEGYWGKIAPTGEIYYTNQLRFGEERDAITKALSEFIADPVAYALRFGGATGRCCFCGLRLTTRDSIFNGYGETCADNWCLPYVKSPADFQPAIEARERVQGRDEPPV